MRRFIVLVVLASLFVGLAFIIADRLEEPLLLRHEVPTDAGVRPSSDGGLAAESDAVVSQVGDARPPPIDRPVRVVGLGWELLAPGILANGGLTPSPESAFEKGGLDCRFRVIPNIDGIEGALAKGGADPSGADIAVVPLSTMVVSYERLRALAPHAFFVVGWSHGHDAIYAVPNFDPGRARRADVALVGNASEPAAMLSLLVLELAGVEADHVKFVRPGDAAAAQAPFAAIDRSAADADRRSFGRRPMVTTADASGWIPYVAIAPKGFIAEHHEVATAWMRAWLDGVSTLEGDVPKGAREISAIEGAPEAIDLLERIGQVDFATLNSNARMTGLSGRGAVTLEALFGQYWSVLRRVGVITTPSPPRTPLYHQAIADLVRANPGNAHLQVNGRPSDFSTPVLLRRAIKAPVDPQAVVRDIGLIAGVFESSSIRVGLRSGRISGEMIIDQACDRYDLPRNRFELTRQFPRGAQGVLEVLAAP